jgi:hypothetical protein
MSPLNRKLFPLNSRLAGYATLAGAALAAPAFAPSADANIVYSGVVNINDPSTTAGIYLNIANGVFAVTPGGAPGWNLNPWGSSSFNLWANNSANAMDGVVVNFTGGSSATASDNLPFGTLIDGTWTYGRTASVETTGLTAIALNSSNNLFGFRFFNSVTSSIDFGWVRISLGATSGAQPRAVVEYAYEDSGAGIGAGVIPEPTTMALLGTMAAGALGVRAWRKRKAA